jgi:general stress protein 26
MKRDTILEFLHSHKLVVEASRTPEGAPQAAVVGYAVTDSLELVFDTLSTTRKFANLRADPRIALVIGWDQVTVQLEGIADFPEGDELERLKECYFGAYPDGRDRLAWPGITHVRVRPTWARYSNYSQDPPEIWELTAMDFA